jgi:G3E family GTPase
LSFQTALNQLIRHEQLDRILIEPSGLGHVDNIAALLQEDSYKTHLRLNGIVCVIDPRHLSQPKYRYHELYLRQLYAADVLVANKCEVVSEDDLNLFDRLADDFKRPSVKIRQAQLTLDIIKCEITEKHKPFQIRNEDLSFYTEVLHFEGTSWQLENMMRALATLKLSRVKGLLVQDEKVAVINISETESSLSYFALSVMKNSQPSVIECIDTKPLDIDAIKNMVNDYRLVNGVK